MPVVYQMVRATVTRTYPCNSPCLYEVSLQWERQQGLVLSNSGRVHGTDHSAYGIPHTCATQQPCKKANKGANSTQGYMLSGQGSTSERCMTDQPEKVKASPPSDS